jgi:FdhD protein
LNPRIELSFGGQAATLTPMMAAPSDAQGVSHISILKVQGNTPSTFEDNVAVEEPLEIQLSFNRRGIRVIKSISVTMRTPGSDRELAAGFLLTEGVVADASAFESWELPEALRKGPSAANILRAVLRDGVEVDVRSLERNFYMTSSCGVCGKTSLEALHVAGRIALDPEQPVWDASLIVRLPALLKSNQALFAATGGLHAAGLFDRDGLLVAVREDVGRHNAVDKLIGSQVLAGRMRLGSNLLLVSGRTSFELVQKAVMAGIPLLAAVGAPSSLAVDLARQYGVTLLGFVGPDRFNVYCGAQRIRFAP